MEGTHQPPVVPQFLSHALWHLYCRALCVNLTGWGFGSRFAFGFLFGLGLVGLVLGLMLLV